MTADPTRPDSSTASPLFPAGLRTTPAEVARRTADSVAEMPVVTGQAGSQLEAVRETARHELDATSHLEVRCQTLRMQHRCPGRCVLTGLERQPFSNPYSQDLRRP